MFVSPSVTPFPKTIETNVRVSPSVSKILPIKKCYAYGRIVIPLDFSKTKSQSADGSDIEQKQQQQQLQSHGSRSGAATPRPIKYHQCPHCPFQSLKHSLHNTHLPGHKPSPERPFKCSKCDFWTCNKQVRSPGKPCTECKPPRLSLFFRCGQGSLKCYQT